MQIALANIGGRDVTASFETEEEAHEPARPRGRRLLETPERRYPSITFPILKPTLDHITSQLTPRIDRLYLFATDQLAETTEERFRQWDTLHFAELADKILPGRMGIRLDNLEPVIMTGINPSRYDEALAFFGEKLHQIVADYGGEIEKCYLITSAGIPACNTALLLHGMDTFAEKAVVIFKPEEADPLAMPMGAQMRRNTALQHLRRFDFAAVAATLAPEQITPAVDALLTYATTRLHFNFAAAAERLTEAAEALPALADPFTSWQAELNELAAGNRKHLLHELYHNARITWEQQRYVDFVIRARRFQQIALTLLADAQPPTCYLLEQLAEGNLTAGPGEWPAGQKALMREILTEKYAMNELKNICFDLGADEERFERTTKDELVRSLIQYADRRGLLTTLLTRSQEDNPDVWGAIDNPPGENQRELYRRLLRLNRLAERFNQTIIGGGNEGIAYEKLVEEEEGTVHTPLDDMAAVCQRLEIPLQNPFRKVQAVLYDLLRAAV